MSISIGYFNDACHNVNRRTGGILMKIFKNLENGSVVEGLLMDVVPNGYRELKAGEVDAAQEKHVPQVSVEDNKLKVVVGSVEHPMLEAHYITNIWVEYSDGTVDRAGLVPGMKPEYVFDLKGRTGKVTVYEYCNLHGLWKNEIEL